MKYWSVWSEGYRATGEHGTATFHGNFEADTFAEACQRWAATTSDPKQFNAERLTYWACRLFDNEADARKSFG